MVYFLKFGASWILPPGIFILALAGLAVYLWRCRRERKAAGILAGITLSFYFLCTGFVADYTMGWLESSYDPRQSRRAMLSSCWAAERCRMFPM